MIPPKSEDGLNYYGIYNMSRFFCLFLKKDGIRHTIKRLAEFLQSIKGIFNRKKENYLNKRQESGKIESHEEKHDSVLQAMELDSCQLSTVVLPSE